MGGDSEWEGRNECHGWSRKDLETHFENIQPYPSRKSLHALQTLRLLDLFPQPWTSLWYEPLRTLVWTSGISKPESLPLEGSTAVTDQVGGVTKEQKWVEENKREEGG